jgi:protein-disulfide isomerase
MKRYLPFLIVGLVAAAAVGGGSMLYRAKRPAPLASSPKTETNAVTDMHTLGPRDAPVTLEEYGDFQCPPCAKLSEPLNQLEREFRPHLRVVFHHFPLVAHAHGLEAALAAEAAGQQGHFWEMHDLLFREQAVWAASKDAQALFNTYAGMLRLDPGRFQKDMQSEQSRARVQADQRQGASLGVSTTPTIFINNKAIPPASNNPNNLREAVEAALKEKQQG